MPLNSPGAQALRDQIKSNIGSLLSRQEGDDIGTLMHIGPNDMISFKQHTFQVQEDDPDMIKLIKSIEAKGIQEPIIAFFNEDTDIEIIAGHRRRFAAQKLNLQTVPVLVMKNLSRDDATFLMCESNLSKRETLLPSERANSYKVMIDAMNRKRGRYSSVENEEQGKATELLAKEIGEAPRTIERYLRLTNLEPALLELVDQSSRKKNTGIAILPAIEISYLPVNFQEVILKIYQREAKSPSHKQARDMHELFDLGQLDEMRIESIMEELKPNQKRSEGFEITNASLLDMKKRMKLGDGPFQDLLVKALQYYQQQTSDAKIGAVRRRL